MAENDVTTTFFANSQTAEAAIARLEKKYADLENAMKQASRRSKQDAADVAGDLKAWAGMLATVGLGYSALSGFISQAAGAQRQFQEQAQATVRSVDEMIRKLRVQGNLTAVQGADTQRQLSAIAVRNATDLPTAVAASEELISQGFDVKSGTGGAVDRLLASMKATNAKPEQIKEIASAYAAFLAATGQEKNTENLERLTRMIQPVFNETALQASDIPELAPKVQALSQVMTPEQIIGQFTVMREKSNADVASTALKIFWTKLQTAAGSEESTRALGEMGLKPEDVDVLGETPGQILDRLAEGLQRVPEERRPIVMTQLFDERATSAAMGLIRDREKAAQYQAMAEGATEEQFTESVRKRTAGPAAAKLRAEEAQREFELRTAQDFEGWSNAAKAIFQQPGVQQGRWAGASQWMLETGIGFRGLFQSPEEAALGVSGLADTDLRSLGLAPEVARYATGRDYLRTKYLEQQGYLPGGVSAEEFLQAATADLGGQSDPTATLQRRIGALTAEQQGDNPQLGKLIEATEAQTKVLQEFLRNVDRKPVRNPGGE